MFTNINSDFIYKTFRYTILYFQDHKSEDQLYNQLLCYSRNDILNNRKP